MTKTNLNINTKIEVIMEEKIYKSVIQDMNDGFMYISVPMGEEGYLPLNPGEEICFNYFIENVGFFYCYSKVLRRVLEGNIPMYMVTLPKEETKIQRRNFVRVPVIENIIYRSIENKVESGLKKGTILNLSGGGVKVKVNEKLNVGDKIKIKLLVNTEKIKIKGEILREEENDSLINDEKIYGIEFEDMSEWERDKIIKKVFGIMQKQRKLV